MGFDTVIASVISIALIIAVAYVFASGSYTLTEMVSLEYRKAVNKAVDVINTRIYIVTVYYDNTTQSVVADVKNNGTTKFNDFSKFDVFLYGRPDGWTETYYPTISSISFDIIAELTNPGIFDPHEIVRLNVKLSESLPNGTYVILVCTPNGVCCSDEFNVGG